MLEKEFVAHMLKLIAADCEGEIGIGLQRRFVVPDGIDGCRALASAKMSSRDRITFGLPRFQHEADSEAIQLSPAVPFEVSFAGSKLLGSGQQAAKLASHAFASSTSGPVRC